jgi:hypothetical protein
MKTTGFWPFSPDIRLSIIDPAGIAICPLTWTGTTTVAVNLSPTLDCLEFRLLFMRTLRTVFSGIVHPPPPEWRLPACRGRESWLGIGEDDAEAAVVRASRIAKVEVRTRYFIVYPLALTGFQTLRFQTARRLSD